LGELGERLANRELEERKSDGVDAREATGEDGKKKEEEGLLASELDAGA